MGRIRLWPFSAVRCEQVERHRLGEERRRAGLSELGGSSSVLPQMLSSSNRRLWISFFASLADDRFLKAMLLYPQITFQTMPSITIDAGSMFFLLDWINSLAVLFASQPLLLVFVVSIAGNIIPFFPTPSLLIIVVIVTSPGSNFQGIGIIEIASIAALGATLGKFMSYALGYGARRAIGKPERFDSLRKFLGGSTFLVGLVFAASPLVDTAFIPLGMIRYSLPKTLLSLYTGKFLWILSVLYVARQSGQLITQSFVGGFYTSILSLALLFPIAYFLILVDWENRLLGRKNTLRNRVISRIRAYFSRSQNSGNTPTVNK